MAGRNKEPVDVLIAKGRKHLTKAEIEQRREQEALVSVPFTDIPIPVCLDDQPDVRAEFVKYAEMLSKIGPEGNKIFTELDVDTLLRYVLAQSLYLKFTGLLVNATKLEEVKAYTSAQSKAFAQAHQSASVLGLNITSRCKLIIPEPPSDGEDKFAEIL